MFLEMLNLLMILSIKNVRKNSSKLISIKQSTIYFVK